MYPVTNEFKIAAKQPVQEHRLYGTIGSVSFDESNIIQGSFHITNQCTDTNDVVLGSVYTGTLTATFTGLSIPRYAWIGKRITVYFGLKTTPTTWEDIPMGVFTVKEAKHSAEGVSITAYDDMIKLDKKFKKSKFKEPAKIYNFLTTICNTCGLILEDSEQTIQSRPNGNTLLGIVGTASNSKLKKYANDIETYRDLVFWIAQSMACFATINKLGHLTFVPYRNENNVVDEITEEHRIAGAVFDDFTTNYTGIYVTNTADGEEIYYGYDEQELEQEISDVEGDIHDVNVQLDQLAYQYQQGQITEAEYKRQKKILDKQLKNLNKRLLWLNEALDKARLEEDGLYMDLGENPMMQADGVGNTPTTMRKRILKALDAISYTPFTCDTVCGAHYDLGDIIRFTGGHATDLGEVCCVMAYDFNMNGEYRMQGFGSDPSKGVMKSKNSKKADKANRNADSSAKNTTGNTTPTSGNDGDLFIQVNDNVGADNIYTGGGMALDSSSGDASTGYTATAHCIDDTRDESIYFKFDGLTVGGTYTMSGSIQIDGDLVNWGQHFFCIACRTVEGVVAGIPCTPGGTVTELSDGTAITLYYDNLEHTYQITFTATATTYYVSINISYLMNTWASPPRTYPTTVSNMKISEGDAPSSGEPSGIKVYTNDQWKNLDYVKKVKQVQTSSGGTKIATAQNSDGSSTDIYAPTIPVEDVKVDGTSVVSSKIANINTMTGATASAAGSKGLVPAPAAGDEQKFLRGDGTFQTVDASGAVELTQAEYNQLTPEQKADPNKVYYIKDAGGGGGGGGASALADLTDVDIDSSSLADGNALVYNATSGKWENGEGGGSIGSGYNRTVLYDTGVALPAQVTLSDDIVNYDIIEIVIRYEQSNKGKTSFFYDAKKFASDFPYVASPNGINTPHLVISDYYPQYSRFIMGDASNKLWCYASSYGILDEVAGIKFGGSGGSGGSSSVDYSTTEQVIGTWIDGKPLYQTTLSLTSSSGNDAQEITLSNYGINNIDVVCKIEGTARATLGYVGLNYFSDNYDKFNLFMKSNNTILVLAHAGDWTHSIPVYVTLQYTKTTD